jgi:hypothetical protein
MSNPVIGTQLIYLTVNTPGQVISIDEETNKLYNTVTGINILLLNNSPNYFSEIKLEINTVEVFPDGFEVIRAMLRTNVPLDYDFKTLNEKGGGSRIKGTYTDVDSGASFPYVVSIALRLENK